MSVLSQSIRLIIFSVSFVAFLGPFSQSIYAPILSDVARHFESPQLLVNLSLSIYTFLLAIMQIIYGPLTDRFGRRKILIPGILIYVIATIGCTYSHSIYQFLIFRGLQAAGIASGSVVAVTVIGDLCKGKSLGRSMGTYQMLVSLGPVLGPVMGGIIWGLAGYQGIVLLLTVVGSIVAIANFFLVKETKSENAVENRFQLSTVTGILRHPIGTSIISLGFVQYYTFFTFLVFFPEILVEKYGLTTIQKGLVFLPLSFCIVIGSFLGGKIIEKVKTDRFLLQTAALNAVMILLTIFCSGFSFPLVILCSGFFGLFLGLSLPVQTTLLSNTFAHVRATAVGIYNFFRFMGIAISPIIGGVIYQWGKEWLLFGFVSALFASCVWFMNYNFSSSEKMKRTSEKIVS